MPDQFTRPLKIDDKGKDVRLAQEWLTFHGFGTVIDGAFGSATELAVKSFQATQKLPQTGKIDAGTQSALLAPLNAVQRPIAVGGKSLPQLYVAYAQQHLKAHPLEIGGQNRGPWVRLYMGGNEGDAWLWCAGFATWVLRQASTAMGVKMPHPYNFGCDTLAVTAKHNKLFIPVNKPADISLVKPGFLFVIRQSNNHWSHIGVVESVQGEGMSTIEGNTDHNGSSNGYEVCRRTRTVVGKDFLVVT